MGSVAPGRRCATTSAVRSTRRRSTACGAKRVYRSRSSRRASGQECPQFHRLCHREAETRYVLNALGLIGPGSRLRRAARRQVPRCGLRHRIFARQRAPAIQQHTVAFTGPPSLTRLVMRRGRQRGRRGALRGEEPVPQGIHRPDRCAGVRPQPFLPAPVRRPIDDRRVGGDDAHRHVVAHRFTTDDARRVDGRPGPRAPDPGRGAAARTRSLHRAYLNRLPLRSHRRRRHGHDRGGGPPFLPVFTRAATSLTVPSTVSELSNSCPISDHCR